MPESTPLCPKCGKAVQHKGQCNGQQRYAHTHSRQPVCKWHGTVPVGSDKEQGIDAAAAKALHKKIATAKGVQRYVVTAAQNATPVNKAFFASLLTYCKHNKAQLLVLPQRYKNPTSIWAAKDQDDDWWAPELAPYLLTARTVLHPSLVVLADIMVQPTASAPLQGLETLVGGKSAIVGHPRLELMTVPTPQSRFPKILTTTGSVTVKNYIHSKVGKAAEHHHTQGACVAEIAGDVFHLRQINAVKNGTFTDLCTDYRPDAATPAGPAAALVLGDVHAEFVSPSVVEATFGKCGIVQALRPKQLVFHDLHDFHARNHHHAGNPFIEFAKHKAGRNNVEQALNETFAFVDQHSPAWATNVFVPSNHPDALARWVREANPKADPVNAVFWARTFEAMLLGSRMTEGGAKTIDPFVFWAKQKLKSAPRTVFLSRDQSYQIAGIECAYHGDQGANGARGSRKGFSKIGVKTIIGHSHSPGICGGAYQTGTSSQLRLEYNSGPSGWLNTHALIYANGKRTLITCVGAKWRV